MSCSPEPLSCCNPSCGHAQGYSPQGRTHGANCTGVLCRSRYAQMKYRMSASRSQANCTAPVGWSYPKYNPEMRGQCRGIAKEAQATWPSLIGKTRPLPSCG